jgi:hypothetical protein
MSGSRLSRKEFIVPLWFRILRIWLPIAVAVTAVCGLAYLAVQQNYRDGLDDPQVQLAQDGAASLDAGASPASVVNSPTIDIAASLSPFVIVFDKDDLVLASGATLVGSAPVPPRGVLATARTAGRNRVTWQPRSGVRIASVSYPAADGRVVLAGRNMREVEARIDRLTLTVALAWVSTLVGVFVVVLLVEVLGRKLDRKDSAAG